MAVAWPLLCTGIAACDTALLLPTPQLPSPVYGEHTLHAYLHAPHASPAPGVAVAPNDARLVFAHDTAGAQTPPI